MKTLNKAMLIGYLGADPKIFVTPKGYHYATFRLATDRLLKKAQEKHVRITTWHAVKIWGEKQMDFVRNNFMKGSHVLVEGMIDHYTVAGDAGTVLHRTEIKASRIMNLDR